jgi:AICAR transformylase/IMP cyclohydrolase PurH
VAAFNRISNYDGAISDYLSRIQDDGSHALFPGQANGRFIKLQDLRYGENPHQQAAFYRDLYPRRARWSRPTAAGQGAELQQHRRRRRGLGMRQEL